MASKPAARFTINVHGKPRTLISVRESKNDDLYLTIKSGDKDRAPWVSGTVPGATSARILDQRYSIHPSPDLPDKNVIKQQLRDQSARVVASRYHHTRAIKGTRKLAELYIRRSPNLGIPKYFLRKNAEKSISLGSYDPNFLTLVYGVYVGARDTKFSLFDAGNVKSIQHRFRTYSVTLLWWFLTLPSHNSGFYRHRVTAPLEVVGNVKTYDGLVNGLTSQECLESFVSQSEYIKREYIEVLCSEFIGRTPEIASKIAALSTRTHYV